MFLPCWRWCVLSKRFVWESQKSKMLKPSPTMTTGRTLKDAKILLIVTPGSQRRTWFYNLFFVLNQTKTNDKVESQKMLKPRSTMTTGRTLKDAKILLIVTPGSQRKTWFYNLFPLSVKLWPNRGYEISYTYSLKFWDRKRIRLIIQKILKTLCIHT